MGYIAHIRDDGAVQTVKEHSKNVAALCAEYAEKFGNEKAGETCGFLHDIGKNSEKFSEKISGESDAMVDHSTAGAHFIKNTVSDSIDARIFETVIASHHTGLYKYGMFETDSATISNRIRNYDTKYDTDGVDLSDADVQIKNQTPTAMFDATMTRMLLSCLVDADRTDTQEFQENKSRISMRSDLNEMSAVLDRFIAEHGYLNGTTGINRLRSDVLKSCIAKGKLKGPLFTLTVPTGVGKTISSLAFALKHAIEQGKDRIIYVVPYCSIIDQTTEQYATILGKKRVLAHHMEAAEENAKSVEKRSATENWDASLIVTTPEQFFESLYSSKNTKLRKIHNIANSVVIFDEAQTLPVEYIEPCVRKLAELMINFRTSVVLCTATQPTLEKYISGYCESAQIRAVEIADDCDRLFAETKRVTYEYLGLARLNDIANMMRNQEQCLTIVQTKRQAFWLYKSLSDMELGDGLLHLSTNMTPYDRTRIIAEIRRRLAEGKPCRVVSTTLIQAGVDIDFPRVYTAVQGLAELIQAAGRCNREGKRPVNESVVSIFEFSNEGLSTPQFLHSQVSAFKFVKRVCGIGKLDSPSAIRKYFGKLYSSKESSDEKSGLDEHGIVSKEERSFSAIDFRDIDASFKLISEDTWTVIVPYNEDCKRNIDAICQGYASKETYRKLGEFSVGISDKDFENLASSGYAEILSEDGKTAALTDMRAYDSMTGLRIYETENILLTI